MAKVYQPLMFTKASGTIAGALTYQMWRGLQICRSTPHPVCPNTQKQIAHRTPWVSVVNFVDTYLSGETDVLSWRRYTDATTTRMTYRNKQISAAWDAFCDAYDKRMFSLPVVMPGGTLGMQYWLTDGSQPYGLSLPPEVRIGTTKENLNMLGLVTSCQSGVMAVQWKYPANITVYMQVWSEVCRSGIYRIRGATID